MSALSLTVITLNLLLWLPFLMVASALRGIPSEAVRSRCEALIEHIYRAAAGFNRFWLVNVLGIEMRLSGAAPPDDRSCSLLVISNHRSWFDVLILQSLIVQDGPLLKFLIKEQLIHVPVIGWICLALGFPRLARRRGAQQQREAVAVTQSVDELQRRPGALLNFVESTRFSPEKRDLQHSSFRHLLQPRAGALRAMLSAAPQLEVLDVTIIYPRYPASLWYCLSGALRHITVHLEYFPRQDLPGNHKSVGEWLTERWRYKDQLIAAHHEEHTHDAV